MEIDDVHVYTNFLKGYLEKIKKGIFESPIDIKILHNFFGSSQTKFLRILKTQNNIHKEKLRSLAKKQSNNSHVSNHHLFKIQKSNKS